MNYRNMIKRLRELEKEIGNPLRLNVTLADGTKQRMSAMEYMASSDPHKGPPRQFDIVTGSDAVEVGFLSGYLLSSAIAGHALPQIGPVDSELVSGMVHTAKMVASPQPNRNLNDFVNDWKDD